MNKKKIKVPNYIEKNRIGSEIQGFLMKEHKEINHQDISEILEGKTDITI